MTFHVSRVKRVGPGKQRLGQDSIIKVSLFTVNFENKNRSWQHVQIVFFLSAEIECFNDHSELSYITNFEDVNNRLNHALKCCFLTKSERCSLIYIRSMNHLNLHHSQFGFSKTCVSSRNKNHYHIFHENYEMRNYCKRRRMRTET